MDKLFNPRAIAVVGASPDEHKLSGRPLKYLLANGYRGDIYPVSARHSVISGLTAYASIDDLPGNTDLGLIMLPAAAVPDALEGLGRRGVAYAISVASGFAESGNTQLQERLSDICSTYDIRLIGPNCVGFINPSCGVTATFSTVVGRRMPAPGHLAIVTQSGALGNAMLQNCNELGLGIRCWVSVGNEADLGALDFLRHLIDDQGTRTIACFIEGLKDGGELVALGRRARANGKTVLVLRAGRSLLGRQASISHTGKLAGSPRVWTDVARQAGILEVRTLDDLVDMCLALELLGTRDPRAPQGLGVLTISGGLGVLVSDFCAEWKIPVPTFAVETQARLRGLLPSQMAVANPVDTALFADEKGYAACAQAVIEDPEVGTLLLILTSLAHDYEALSVWLTTFAARARQNGRRVAVSFLSSADQATADQRRRLHEAGILVLPDALRVVKALGGLALLASDVAASASATAPEGGAFTTGDHQVFLDLAGIASPAAIKCASASEAVVAANRIGIPVVMKVASPDLPHKTEAGGVRLDLASPAAVEAAFAGIMDDVRRHAPQARIEGVTVQAMVQDGVELILGGTTDPELGKVIILGSGGILAELLDDVTFRVPPLSRRDADDMIHALRCAPLLRGFRNLPKADLAALSNAIMNVAAIFAASPDLREVDINPLSVLPDGKGVKALDVLLVRNETE